jgi:tRNA(fMet)-specific endonuclease VapC
VSYLLDTNTCIRYLNDARSTVSTHIASTPANQIFLCHIVKAELYYGAYKSTRQRDNLALLSSFFRRFAVVPFDDVAAEVYGQIRADLEQKGTPIGPNDLIIAAIAIAHKITLVTHNVREFGRVQGLAWVDWEQPTR